MSIISDLAALARAGFTPAQVKEILKIQDGNSESKPEEPAAIIPKEELPPEPVKKEPEEKPLEDKNKEPETNETIENLRAELEKVRSDLVKAQNLNIRADNSGEQKNTTDTINDIVRAFM